MSDKPAAALFVGDVTYDLTVEIDKIPDPDEKQDILALSEDVGGVATNSAIACKWAGSETRLMCRLGTDDQGKAIHRILQELNLADLASFAEGQSSRAIVLLEPHGEKRLSLFRGISMFPSVDDISGLTLDSVGWVHAATYDVRAAELLFEKCRVRNIPWSLDLEPSTFPGGLATLKSCIANVDTVFCNTNSVKMIGEDAIGKLRAMGAKNIVLTEGGSQLKLIRQEAVHEIKVPRIKVVDTTGAGDCLAGWYVSGRIKGHAPALALEKAASAASLSCTRRGGYSSYPRAQDFPD